MELYIAKQCSKATCSDWSVKVNVKATQLTAKEDLQWVTTKISALDVGSDNKRFFKVS